jgi:hypothetical protein
MALLRFPALLSPEAQAALKEFKSQAATPAQPKAENDDFVSEDFGKSQFWVSVSV